MKTTRTVAERFMWLGVFAIALAGLYSLIPVLGRTPQLKHLGIMQQLFDVALVVHVDLSVLIWFFSMLGMGVCLVMQLHPRWNTWLNAGFITIAISTILMALSPFDVWLPVKSNYIPVLHNPTFLLSLGLLFAGLFVTLLPPIIVYAGWPSAKTLGGIGLGWQYAALAGMLGLIGYALGGYYLPPDLEIQPHYEALFWGGGHIMQFCYTLIAMAAWLTLLRESGSTLPSYRSLRICYMLAVIGAAVSLGNFTQIPLGWDLFTTAQTQMMIEFGGLGPTMLAFLILARLLKTPKVSYTRAYRASLMMSLLLFFFGGILGMMITGQNVTIPAHYHGMIVGITMALMGLAYAMLPRFGYVSVGSNKLAFWQPIVYGIGQFMHIGGLAYCGGYGILRKTAGGFENLAWDIKVALGIFGLGGLIAITGGLLFVVVMLRVRRDSSVSLQPGLL